MSEPEAETRGGVVPGDWRVRKPPPNPDGSVFEDGLVMAQPGDPPVEVFMVIAE